MEDDVIVLSVRPSEDELCRKMFQFLEDNLRYWGELSQDETDFRGFSQSISKSMSGPVLKLDFRVGCEASDHEVHYWRTLANWIALQVGELHRVKVEGEVQAHPVVDYEGERWPLILESKWGGERSPDDLGIGMLVDSQGFVSRMGQLKHQLSFHLCDTEGAFLQKQKGIRDRQKEVEDLIQGEVRRLEGLWGTDNPSIGSELVDGGPE